MWKRRLSPHEYTCYLLKLTYSQNYCQWKYSTHHLAGCINGLFCQYKIKSSKAFSLMVILSKEVFLKGNRYQFIFYHKLLFLLTNLGILSIYVLRRLKLNEFKKSFNLRIFSRLHAKLHSIKFVLHCRKWIKELIFPIS